MDAEFLRRKAAELLKQATAEHDPVKRMELLELAVAFIVKARELERRKKLD